MLFETKNGDSASCVKLIQDPNSEISVLNDAFQHGAGPQNIFSAALKWANTHLLTILEPAPGGNVYFDFCKNIMVKCSGD